MHAHRAAGAFAALFVCALGQAQSIHATRVIASNTNGGAGGGSFNPALALGAPGGALDVHSLGIGGDLTLGFAVVITDGPGADLLVSENPFHVGFSESFAEVAFIEVSSNGTDFARFPSAYFGPPTDPGPFGTLTVGSYEDLAGQTPVLAVQNPMADLQDVVEAGGDAFDLADLRNHPLVVAQRVDLNAITQLRLVDAVNGISLDSRGVVIRDPGAGSADIDAITVIHHQGNLDPRGPRVGLTVAADGTARLRIEDPDGWQDLDPGTLRAAIFGQPIDAFVLLSTLRLVQADASGFTFAQPTPLPPSLLYRVSVSVKDRAGNRSGASRSRPDGR